MRISNAAPLCSSNGLSIGLERSVPSSAWNSSSRCGIAFVDSWMHHEGSCTGNRCTPRPGIRFVGRRGGTPGRSVQQGHSSVFGTRSTAKVVETLSRDLYTRTMYWDSGVGTPHFGVLQQPLAGHHIEFCTSRFETLHPECRTSMHCPTSRRLRKHTFPPQPKILFFARKR